MDYKKKYEELIKEIGTSFSKAIKAMCYQCSGYSYKDVRTCTCKDCPLYILKENRKNKKKDQCIC